GHNPLLQKFDAVFALHRSRSGRGEPFPGELATFSSLCGKTPLRGMEVSFRRKDGEEKRLLLSAAPWLGVFDELLGSVIILTDITALKQAERSLAKVADEAQKRSQSRAEFI